MTARRVTLLTLAEDMGVSRATVSNAYNHPDQLSQALRERILTRAGELGFAGPDPTAAGLRRGRVGAVGVLVDEGLSYAFSDPTAVLFLDGLARAVQSDGFGLLLHAGTGTAADVRMIRRAAVDAWVVQSLPEGHPMVTAARAQGRPLVVLDQPALPGTPLVSVDDAGGAKVAVDHLWQLGHRWLGVLTMPLRADRQQGLADPARRAAATYRVMQRRLTAVGAAFTAAGGDWAQVPVVECAANDTSAGAVGTDQLRHLTPRPTAILALSDQLAMGALRAARDADLHVPDELSVVGFDDSPFSRYADPPLTTVAQPLLERGEAVGRLLLTLLRGERAPQLPPFPVRLVVRESTGPPR